MKKRMIAYLFGAIALAMSAAVSAQVSVNIGINPLGFGYEAYPPPVIYQPDPYYAPYAGVYLGDGAWGGDRERHQRGYSHGNREHGRGGHGGNREHR